MNMPENRETYWQSPPSSRYSGERVGERGERRETPNSAGCRLRAPNPSPPPSPRSTGKREVASFISERRV
jgi:hypothetical protein